MKKILKKVLLILFDILLVPVVLLYFQYLFYCRKKKPIKQIDKFFDFLLKIEEKLQR